MSGPRDAFTGVAAGRKRRRGGRGEQPMVPDAQFTSYYGKPVLNKPVWAAPDIAGYLFLGGLAGASSVLAAGAHLTGRHHLARASKVGALGAIGLSTVALIHDLGRPDRFYNMLRVFKPTSPMNVGSWILSGYGPAAGAAAFSAVTGRLRPIGALGTAGAAVLGPAVATYTAVLIGDTAVPAWHEGRKEMPFVFAGSSCTAAGGLGLLAAPVTETGPARRMATVGGLVELTASQILERRIGMVAEPYKQGKAGVLMRTGEALTAAGLAGAWLGRRNRIVSAISGAALVTASAVTRFGIFEAGIASANDPKYTVVPQRDRARARDAAAAAASPDGGAPAAGDGAAHGVADGQGAAARSVNGVARDRARTED